MKKKNVLFNWLASLACALLCAGILSIPAHAATTKPSNMLHNCEPYYMKSTEIGDFDMAGVTYTDGLIFRIAHGYQVEADFNFDGNYKSMSFQVGHIDNRPASTSGITLTITADSQTVQTLSLSNTDIPTDVSLSLEGVRQLQLKWKCNPGQPQFVTYFGIGAIDLKSNGAVRDILLEPETLELSEKNPSAYLTAHVVPSDAIDTKVSWVSSNANVATVDSNGLVRGISGGEAEISATVAGTYAAKCKVKVDMPINISAASVSLSQTTYTYSGAANTPQATVICNGTTLKAGTDYAISYASNVNAGTATATITGQNNYKGTLSKNFTIQKASPTLSYKKSYAKSCGDKPFSLNVKRSGNGKLTYSSSDTSVATVSSSGKVTIKKAGASSITITVSETNNYKAKRASITITGAPKQAKLSSVKTKGSQKLAVRWSRDGSATGYEIQYSTNPNFKSDVKKQVIKKNSTTTATLKKLTKGKKYYVRIRAYKTVKANGKTKTLYGKWSKKLISKSVK